MSIEQQMAQKYTAFAKQQQEADAVAEADNLLNDFAPPRKSEQPRIREVGQGPFFPTTISTQSIR